MVQKLKHKLFVADVFTVKRRLRDYRREIGSKTEIIQKEGLFGRSGKVVLTAIAMYVLNSHMHMRICNCVKSSINFSLSRNASNFLCKLIAWLYTGSHSMFSECVHSAADTCNQLILAYGIHKSVQVNHSCE